MSDWEDGKDALGCLLQVVCWIAIIALIGAAPRIWEWVNGL